MMQRILSYKSQLLMCMFSSFHPIYNCHIMLVFFFSGKINGVGIIYRFFNFSFQNILFSQPYYTSNNMLTYENLDNDKNKKKSPVIWRYLYI